LLTFAWQNGYLLDGANPTISWAERKAFDSTTVEAIDWENRLLRDNANAPSVGWQDRLLQDDNNLTSVNWKNRQLDSENGTHIVIWQTNGLGFFNTAPQPQQTGGAATATPIYTATEQAMLQTAYDALRTYGLLT